MKGHNVAQPQSKSRQVHTKIWVISLVGFFGVVDGMQPLENDPPTGFGEMDFPNRDAAYPQCVQQATNCARSFRSLFLYARSLRIQDSALVIPSVCVRVHVTTKQPASDDCCADRMRAMMWRGTPAACVGSSCNWPRSEVKQRHRPLQGSPQRLAKGVALSCVWTKLQMLLMRGRKCSRPPSTSCSAARALMPVTRPS